MIAHFLFRHPDRNKSPEAASEFVEVVSAYQLLIDPERKNLYDNRGIYDERSHMGSRRRDENLFNFATGGSFHFPFSDGINYLHKESVSGKYVRILLKICLKHSP